MAPLTHTERDALVSRILHMRGCVEDAIWKRQNIGADTENPIVNFREELSTLHRRYAQDLPRITVSRCPFSGSILEQALDPWGLDGPWWDADWPIRQWIEAPRSLLVLSGAMTLTEPLEPAPFLVLPGPNAPCVEPSLLRRSGVVAVVSSIPIGRHTAYPVAYFVDPETDEPPTLNSWGSRRWTPPWGELALELEIIEEENQLDPNLEPWIRNGKLMWIAPHDTEMRLHATVSRCPYLGLEGSTEPARIFDGQLQEVQP